MALRKLLSRGRTAAVLFSAVAAASTASADPQLMFDAPSTSPSGGTDLTTLAGPDQSTGQSLVSSALDGRPSAQPAAASPTTASLSGSNAATSEGVKNDGILDFVYDPATGDMKVRYDGDSRITAANPLQVIRFKSASGQFLPAAFQGGGFSNTTADSSTINGTILGAGSLPDGYDLGQILAAHMDIAALLPDLTLQWNVSGGGLTLKNGDIIAVPEPATLGLIGIGALGLLARRQRSRE
jgi:PEP-CTERM motif